MKKIALFLLAASIAPPFVNPAETPATPAPSAAAVRFTPPSAAAPSDLAFDPELRPVPQPPSRGFAETSRRAAWTVWTQRFHAGLEETLIEPTVEASLSERDHVRAWASMMASERFDDEVTGVFFEYLRRLTDETRVRPSLYAGVEAAMQTAFGEGVDYTLKALAAKTIGRGAWRQVYAGAEAILNTRVLDYERGNGARFSAGYAQELSDDALFFAEVARERTTFEGYQVNSAEIGVRRALSPRIFMESSIGCDVDDDENADVWTLVRFRKDF
jgi:hypothetical protein